MIREYYEQYVRRNIVWKYNINKRFMMAEVEKVEVYVLCGDLVMGSLGGLMRSMKYLEGLLGVVPEVKNCGVRGWGEEEKLKVKVSVELRGRRMYWFIDYIVYVVLPILMDRYGAIVKYRRGEGLLIKVEDVNGFTNLKDEYDFDGEVYIRVYFRRGTIGNNYLLEEVGIAKRVLK